MQSEALSLVGEHDFAAYRSADDMRTVTVRHLTEVRVEQSPHDERVLDIFVQGNRFMYNMVRIIAGTLVDVGRGKRPKGACAQALESKDRRDLGVTAPPHGLHLVRVELSTRGEDGWPRLRTD
jgi:tRNA pseudouridine38-40 synthase